MPVFQRLVRLINGFVQVHPTGVKNWQQCARSTGPFAHGTGGSQDGAGARALWLSRHAPSCPRRRASSMPQHCDLVSDALEYWIPACAGMTPKTGRRFVL